jgi:hypothetical protein
MTLALPNKRPLLTPGWSRNELTRRAKASPSLDLRLADNKSLIDAVTGQSLVTFTRASSGTYVGSDGLIKTATTNLLLRSEEFDTGWTGSESNTTVTANTNTAPNGTLTADTIDFTNASSYRYQVVSNAPAGATFTFSVWVASNTKTQTVIRIAGTSTGSGGQLVVNLTPTLTRYSLTVTIPSGNTAAFVGFENRTGVGGGNGSTGTIIAWGAQLEESPTVGEYIPTTSVINSAPRFDHNPTTGESLGLLVEEQRTNLLLQSNGFDTTWTNSNSNETTAAGTAPDGTNTAWSFTDTADVSPVAHELRQANIAGTSGLSYTYSVYAKAGTLPELILALPSAIFGASAATRFNLSNGSITSAGGGVTSSIVSVGGGWYRLMSTATATASATGAYVLRLGNGTGGTYQGNGTGTVFIWGAQLEVGAFPTSYIPTTTATVTRSADVASITGANFSSWYRQDEGTVFVKKGLSRSFDVSRISLEFGDGTNNNRFFLGSNTAGAANAAVVATATTQASLASANAFLTGTANSSLAYRLDDFALVVNGGTPAVDVSGTVPTVSALYIGKAGSTASVNWSGTINRLTYWPQRLSNTTLQEVTR